MWTCCLDRAPCTSRKVWDRPYRLPWLTPPSPLNSACPPDRWRAPCPGWTCLRSPSSGSCLAAPPRPLARCACVFVRGLLTCGYTPSCSLWACAMEMGSQPAGLHRWPPRLTAPVLPLSAGTGGAARRRAAQHGHGRPVQRAGQPGCALRPPVQVRQTCMGVCDEATRQANEAAQGIWPAQCLLLPARRAAPAAHSRQQQLTCACDAMQRGGQDGDAGGGACCGGGCAGLGAGPPRPAGAGEADL